MTDTSDVSEAAAPTGNPSAGAPSVSESVVAPVSSSAAAAAAPGPGAVAASPVADPATHQAAVQHIVEQISAATGGQVQAAIDTGFAAASINDGTVYPAWSTSKVALAIAALNAHAVDTGTVNAAITASDNAAAGRLWSSLGGGAAAASAADAVLRAGGDTTTHYQSQQVAPPYSAFGQTMWPVRAQARFGRTVQCVAGSAYVVGAMGRIIPSQAYGMGRIPGAHFKGGWGPDPAGRYTTRQFGFAPDGQGGVIGVALVARPSDGSYASGQALLNSASAVIARGIADGTLTASAPCSVPAG